MHEMEKLRVLITIAVGFAVTLGVWLLDFGPGVDTICTDAATPHCNTVGPALARFSAVPQVTVIAVKTVYASKTHQRAMPWAMR
jgi:hypothetical protein